MATEGPNYGSTSSSLGDGAASWNNLGNLYADDGSRADVVLSSGQTSDTLRIQGFGFAIPTGATINGIELTMERGLGIGAGTFHLDSLALTKTGVAVGDDKADTGNFWPNSSFETVSFGGSADTWGQSWTAAEINASTFGVRLRVMNDTSGGPETAMLDYVKITITYTPDGGDPVVVSAIVPVHIHAGSIPPPFAEVLDAQTEIVAVVDAVTPDTIGVIAPPAIVRPPQFPIIAVSLEHDDDTTVGWVPSIVGIVANRGPLLPAVLVSAGFEIPAGFADVCACPFGAEVVELGFATAEVVSVEHDNSSNPRPHYTAEVVSSGFATAEVVNVCHCPEE